MNSIFEAELINRIFAKKLLHLTKKFLQFKLLMDLSLKQDKKLTKGIHK